jgi:4-hydroxy-tetrahydrodipicolinate synthase
LYVSPMLALGADGAILAAAHVCTSTYASLVSLWRRGEADAARALGHRLAPLSAALFAEPNPAVIKAVLHRLGEIPSPAVRLPLMPASGPVTDEAERLAAWLPA